MMATTRHVTRAARAVVTAAVFIFSILLSSSAQPVQGATSSCDIPCVIGTGPTSLTCTFSVDVNETKSNFTVVRLGDGDSQGVGIVSCTWRKDQLSCTTAPGFEISSTVTDHLVIRVPRASRDHSGSYVCRVAGSKVEGFEPCAVIVIPGDNAGVIVGVTVGFLGIGFAIAIYIVRIYRPQCRRTISRAKNWSDEKDPAKKIPKEEKSSTGNLIAPEEEKNLTSSEKAQEFRMKWVEAAFPDLDSRAYFLPPVYVNRVPMTRQSVAGQDVLVLEQASGRDRPAPTKSAASRRSTRLPTVQDSDVRDDEAMQRIFMCLQTMSEQNSEVMVGISQLQFGQSKGYRTLPWHAAAAALLPEPTDLSPDQTQNIKEGDFDVLLIHRHYGFVIFEVKSVGRFKMSQEKLKELIRRKISDAIKQLKNAEANLSHLVSDIAPNVRITKTIALPNLTAHQVQQALSGDSQLATDLCRCLGIRDPADIAGVCLCSDQLSDPKTPCDASSHVLRELGHWWQRRVAGAGPDTHMTLHVYKSLVARFCGPATVVTVPCTSPPRVSVKTLGQAVWCTGECYTAQITLFPEQVFLLNRSSPRQFVTGPPGTGKTVVLMLIAIQWLYSGHHVYIVSTWLGNRAVCIMLYNLLLQTVNTQQSAGVSPGQPHLLLYDFDGGKDVEKAVNDLSQAASGGSLYVIADEVGLELGEDNFQTFCDKLLTQFPRLNLWAATCFHGDAPASWQVTSLTRPLRSPPAVIREYEPARSITELGHVLPYRERGVPDHTDGPPVRRLYHRGQGQLGDWAADCVTCGREVASFLHSLRVGVTENVTTASATTGGTTPPCLRWRDVLVLYWFGVNDNSGVVRALRGAGIPVRVMKNDDNDFEDVATARSDVVWVALGDQVRGLERKIVVCLDDNARLHCMSRCTSQLVIISAGDKLHEHDLDFDTCHPL